MLLPIPCRGGTRPFAKRTTERAGLGKTNALGNLFHRCGCSLEQLARHEESGLANQGSKIGTGRLQLRANPPCGQPELVGYALQRAITRTACRLLVSIEQPVANIVNEILAPNGSQLSLRERTVHLEHIGIVMWRRGVQ